MKLIAWNSRGTGYDSFMRSCMELLRKERPDVLCLTETKASFGVGKKLAKSLKFSSCYEVPACGFTGGLILLWNDSSINLRVVSCHDQVHTEIFHFDDMVLVSFVYVQPNATSKDIFWSHLIDMALRVNQPWVVIGDFNDIGFLGERKGGSGDCIDRILKFRDRWSSCDLVDPGYIGCPFTWVRRCNGRIVLQERLDRVLWNDRAMLLFPEAKVRNSPRICSDHNPVIFCSELTSPPRRDARPFRFEAAWLTHGSFSKVFKSAWERHGNSFQSAIESVTSTVL